jgi:heme/copper-type cytochrome/quinol oxidase subunit 2
MEAFYIMLGLVIIYSVIHFFMIQNKKNWKQRTPYEKFVTVVAIIGISLIFINTMYS